MGRLGPREGQRPSKVNQQWPLSLVGRDPGGCRGQSAGKKYLTFVSPSRARLRQPWRALCAPQGTGLLPGQPLRPRAVLRGRGRLGVGCGHTAGTACTRQVIHPQGDAGASPSQGWGVLCLFWVSAGGPDKEGVSSWLERVLAGTPEGPTAEGPAPSSGESRPPQAPLLILGTPRSPSVAWCVVLSRTWLLCEPLYSSVEDRMSWGFGGLWEYCLGCRMGGSWACSRH